jgi:hypothetical protein
VRQQRLGFLLNRVSNTFVSPELGLTPQMSVVGSAPQNFTPVLNLVKQVEPTGYLSSPACQIEHHVIPEPSIGELRNFLSPPVGQIKQLNHTPVLPLPRTVSPPHKEPEHSYESSLKSVTHLAADVTPQVPPTGTPETGLTLQECPTALINLSSDDSDPLKFLEL